MPEVKTVSENRVKKTCPHCAEQIESQATICRYCSRPQPQGMSRIEQRGTNFALGVDTRSDWAVWDLRSGQWLGSWPPTEEGWKLAWTRWAALKAVPVGSSQPNLWAIVSITCAVIGFLVLPVLFGPAAIITGVVGVSMNQRSAWAGIVLGAVEILIVLLAFVQIANLLNGV